MSLIILNRQCLAVVIIDHRMFDVNSGLTMMISKESAEQTAIYMAANSSPSFQ